MTPTTPPQWISTKEIGPSGDFQLRAAINDQTITEYAELIREADEAEKGIWPFDAPCVVYELDDGSCVLVDGFHRHEAMLKAERTKIWAEVRQGTRLDALRHALGANASHGLRRSHADKRKAV